MSCVANSMNRGIGRFLQLAMLSEKFPKMTWHFSCSAGEINVNPRKSYTPTWWGLALFTKATEKRIRNFLLHFTAIFWKGAKFTELSGYLEMFPLQLPSPNVYHWRDTGRCFNGSNHKWKIMGSWSPPSAWSYVVIFCESLPEIELHSLVFLLHEYMI